MSGSVDYNYHFDGSDCDNGEMHDGLDYRENKTAFCKSCGLNVTKLVGQPKQPGEPR